MTDSILNSTKKILGIDAEYTAFDLDIITHINSVFADLMDLGVGPDDGFMIEDSDTTWGDYLGEDRNLNSVKTYVYLRVRLLFDPPTSSFHLTAIEKQIEELAWRLNVRQENRFWSSPIDDTVLDGGAPDDSSSYLDDSSVFDGGTP